MDKDPESDLIAGSEEKQGEPKKALSAPEDPIVTALKDEPSDTLSILQEDEDLIEYIEAVDEEKSLG